MHVPDPTDVSIIALAAYFVGLGTKQSSRHVRRYIMVGAAGKINKPKRVSSKRGPAAAKSEGFSIIAWQNVANEKVAPKENTRKKRGDFEEHHRGQT